MNLRSPFVLCPAVLLACLCFSPAIAQEKPGDTERRTELVQAALERTTHQVTYDGRYLKIVYPGGDVPDSIGVCTDVVIRSYRKIGIDLQKEVHEDMRAHFSVYPKNWGLKRPDTNIDHRRVPNLQVFFRRHGRELPARLSHKNFTFFNIDTKLFGQSANLSIIA